MVKTRRLIFSLGRPFGRPLPDEPKEMKSRGIETMKMPKVDKNAVRKAEDEIKRMKNQFVTAEKKAMEQAKKNPERALLLAAGVGAAIGAITVALLKRKD